MLPNIIQFIKTTPTGLNPTDPSQDPNNRMLFYIASAMAAGLFVTVTGVIGVAMQWVKKIKQRNQKGFIRI